MLTQQLRVEMGDNSGVLTIQSGPQNLAELQGLASELSLRMNVTTNGDIMVRPPEPTPPPPEE